MLKSDVLALKKSLKEKRRNRKFDNQFASMLYLSPYSSSDIQSKFCSRFPNLTYAKQLSPSDYSYCSVINSFTNNFTNNTKSQHDQDDQLNKEDQIFWKNHYKSIKSLPDCESTIEIKRIIKAFQSISNAKQFNRIIDNEHRQINDKNIYDTLFESYKEEGGQKTFEQLKDKIQSDVMFLVSRQSFKKNGNTEKKQ